MLTFPPDITFVIQIICFFALWFGLQRLVFAPFLKVLEERECRTSGERHAADDLRAATAATAAEFERRMSAVRATIAGESEGARTAAHGEERGILDSARAEANTKLLELRQRLERDAAAARPALTAEARTLASAMAERVAGRVLS